MHRALTSCLFGASLLFASTASFAEDEPNPYPECTKDPTDAEVAAAKGAFQAGTASFDEADYPRAITYWEDAYRRDCTANALLRNLSRAYELNGQKRHAVMALETFLAREPNDSQKEQILRRIDVLKKQIETDKAQATPTPAPTPSATNAAPVSPTPAPTPEPPTSDHSGKRSIVPLIVAGGGVAIGVVGAVIYAGAASDISDFEKKCPDRHCTGADAASQTSDGNAARRRANLGGVVLGAGAVVAVGGVVWYFLQPRKAESARWSPTPEVGPGFAGLSLHGAF